MNTWVIFLYVLYGALAFGLRMAVHWARTGATGWKGLDLSGSLAAQSGGVLFIAALALGTIAPFLDDRGLGAPIAALDTPAVHIMGFILYALGVAGTVYAQFAMGSSWRIGVDAEERTMLVTGGPFAYVRNPIYTAMMAAVLGLALLLPNAAALGAVLLLLLGLEIHVRALEEPYLGRIHGAAYARYAADVGRFLPGIGRLPRRSDSVGGARPYK